MFALELLFDENAAAGFAVNGIDCSFMAAHCSAALGNQSLLDLAGVSTVELSVNWLAESDMKALNLQYRGKNASTNVLSFGSELPTLDQCQALLDDQAQASALLVLGDIVLCPPVIEREAVQQMKTLRDHWAHMLVHATLHLCGYDHQDATQAANMEALEVNILTSAGTANPYLAQSI